MRLYEFLIIDFLSYVGTARGMFGVVCIYEDEYMDVRIGSIE